MGFVIQAADPESAAGTVVAGLAEAFGITSYNQKRILLDVTTDLFRTQRGFTFPWLVAELELLREALKHSFDLKANIVRLLTRFEPYGDLYRLFIVMAKVDAIPGGLIEIVQLSDLPAHQRKHLTAFLLSLLWSQIRSSNEGCREEDESVIYRVVDGDRFTEEPSEGQNEQLPALTEKTVNGIFRPIRFIGPNSFGRGGGPGE